MYRSMPATERVAPDNDGTATTPPYGSRVLRACSHFGRSLNNFGVVRTGRSQQTCAMNRCRTAVLAFVAVSVVSGPVGPTRSEAATPRANSRCRRSEVGVNIGAVRCVELSGPRYVWQRLDSGSTQKTTASDRNACDPNYDPCVPIASDVDCAGGSGNGPAYVVGPVRVIGTDVYRLDADHNGIGCERR